MEHNLVLKDLGGMGRKFRSKGRGICFEKAKGHLLF